MEQLGSEIPRIIQAYKEDCFQFSENFLRIILPSEESLSPPQQDTPHVEELLKVRMAEANYSKN